LNPNQGPDSLGGSFPHRGEVVFGKGKASMSAGVVKWFNAEKGFGFIIPDEGGPELFVHQSSLHTSGLRILEESTRVKFDIAQGPKGPMATNVQKA